jgi:hypothetical protein
MIKYSAIEKQKIMLNGDLLANSLNLAERNNISLLEQDMVLNNDFIIKSAIDDNLKERVIDILGQGMMLSLELEKLAQRGVEVVFKEDNCLNPVRRAQSLGQSEYQVSYKIA